jgi:hypothetical protein
VFPSNPSPNRETFSFRKLCFLVFIIAGQEITPRDPVILIVKHSHQKSTFIFLALKNEIHLVHSIFQFFEYHEPSCQNICIHVCFFILLFYFQVWRAFHIPLCCGSCLDNVRVTNFILKQAVFLSLCTKNAGCNFMAARSFISGQLRVSS